MNGVSFSDLKMIGFASRRGITSGVCLRNVDHSSLLTKEYTEYPSSI